MLLSFDSLVNRLSSDFFIRFTLLSFNIISIDFLQINELLYVFSFVNTCMLIPLHSFGSHTRTHTHRHTHMLLSSLTLQCTFMWICNTLRATTKTIQVQFMSTVSKLHYSNCHCKLCLYCLCCCCLLLLLLLWKHVQGCPE